MCRAFCRFLFEVHPAGVQQQGKSIGASKNLVFLPPDRTKLMSLPYIHSLRPSTILGYLLACAPTQCPLPVNSLFTKDGAPDGLDLYIEELLDLSSIMADTPSGKVTSVRSFYVHSKGNPTAWKNIANEKKNWEKIQQCLDTFFQRITVADGEQHKQHMRLWYETIMDIGSQFF